MKFSFKKMGAPLSAALVVALSFAGFMGVKNLCLEQRTIDLSETMETVNDQPMRSDITPIDIKAGAAVLIDQKTGQLIYSLNGDKKMAPASVTKVMTMLLVMEACEDKKISLKDKVTISENAASMGGSQMYMEPGEEHTVDELMYGIAMASANDGCVALAEYVSGSEDTFIDKMNKRARELGMENTAFINTNGLPAKGHYTSAYDIAVMSGELLKHEKIKEYTNTWMKDIKVGLEGREKTFTLTNTNKLIKSYKGAYGLKTGFTEDAGYCLSAAAKRGDTDLVAVILDAESSKERNREISRLLDYGFSTYESAVIFRKGESTGSFRIKGGEPEEIEGIAGEDISCFVKKGEKDKVKTETVIYDDIKLPLKKGEKIGYVKAMYNGQECEAGMITAGTDIKKATFFNYLKRTLKSVV